MDTDQHEKSAEPSAKRFRSASFSGGVGSGDARGCSHQSACQEAASKCGETHSMSDFTANRKGGTEEEGGPETRCIQEEQPATPTDPDIGTRVSKAVQDAFRKLPKNGKPQTHEYTVLAGFAVTGNTSSAAAEPQVVAVGTGTKCLGASQRSCKGDVVNDSHAEVIARRALLAWLQDQLEAVLPASAEPEPTEPASDVPQPKPAKQPSGTVFWYDSGTRQVKVRPGVQLHLYVSQPPCGDASLFCGGAASGGGGEAAEQLQGQVEHRTGAKILSWQGPAPAGGGAEECTPPVPRQQLPGSGDPRAVALPQAGEVETGMQQRGAARRKPGRGDATLSMSCSDKIARWGCLGLQGCLLSGILDQPLRLSSITVSLTPQVCPQTAAAAGSPGACSDRRSASGPLSWTAGPAVPSSLQGCSPLPSQPACCHPLAAAAAAALLRAVHGRVVEPRSPWPGPPASKAAGTGTLAQLRGPGSCPDVYVMAPAPSDLGLYPDAHRQVLQGVSVNWSCGPADKHPPSSVIGVHEVTLSASGKKAGVSRKNLKAWMSERACSRLCSRRLALRSTTLLVSLLQERFHNMPGGEPGSQAPASTDADASPVTVPPVPPPSPCGIERSLEHLLQMPYWQLKAVAGPQYHSAWQALREGDSCFAMWLEKPREMRSWAVGRALGS